MLFGKTIVVTGAASGIGRRTAELAGQLGAEVIGIDRVKPAQVFGQFLEGDLSTAEGAAAIAAALPQGLDALCNVAGVSGNGGAAQTLAINVFGLRALSEALVPKLRQGASVVNVASIAGYGWRANLDRAKATAALPGFPDAAQVVADFAIPDAAGYPVSKEFLLVWTMMAARAPPPSSASGGSG